MDINITTFILALVGALAWLPQIISWISELFAKPKLRFVPEESCEIGYTFLGSIFNGSFAISTSNKDALIERIVFVVVHESGARHEFQWKFLDEKGPEITSLRSGEKAELRKNQPAIALKLSTLGLAEKKIGSQDLAYQNKLTLLFRKFDEEESHLKKTRGKDYVQETIKTKEFSELLDCIKTGFYWLEGKYDVYLYAYEVTLKKPHIEHFKFELSKSNVEYLENNIKITQEHFRDLVLLKGGELKELPQRNWNWVNPSFSRKQEKA